MKGIIEAVNQSPEQILTNVMPTTPDVLRIALIDNGIVDTYKAAHELYVGPFLASLATLESVQVESVA